MEQQLQQLKEKYAFLETEKINQQKDYEDKISNLTSKVADLESSNNSLNEKIRNQNADIQKIQNQHTDAVNSHTASINTLKSQLQVEKKNSADIADQLQKALSQVKQVQGIISEKDKAIEVVDKLFLV